MRHLLRWLTLPKRKWRGRGFGIHSPFAFSLITKVISERSPYYCYSSLRSLDKRRFTDTALLVRLLCHFKPESIALVGDDASLLKKTAYMADGSIATTTPLSASLTIVENPALLTDVIKSDVIIVYNLHRRTNRELWNKLLRSTDRGMDFSDGLTGVLCRLNHLPRQSFSIAIPRPRIPKD